VSRSLSPRPRSLLSARVVYLRLFSACALAGRLKAGQVSLQNLSFLFVPTIRGPLRSGGTVKTSSGAYYSVFPPDMPMFFRLRFSGFRLPFRLWKKFRGPLRCKKSPHFFHRSDVYYLRLGIQEFAFPTQHPYLQWNGQLRVHLSRSLSPRALKAPVLLDLSAG